MSDASRTGRRNLREGKRAEVQIARWLTDHNTFGCQVVTWRSVTGGTQRGGDLCGLDDDGHPRPLPYLVEVKYTPTFAPASWLEQAAQASDGRPYLVIWKQPNKPLDHAFVIEPHDEFVWSASWLKYWAPLEEAAA